MYIWISWCRSNIQWCIRSRNKQSGIMNYSFHIYEIQIIFWQKSSYAVSPGTLLTNSYCQTHKTLKHIHTICHLWIIFMNELTQRKELIYSIKSYTWSHHPLSSMRTMERTEYHYVQNSSKMIEKESGWTKVYLSECAMSLATHLVLLDLTINPIYNGNPSICIKSFFSFHEVILNYRIWYKQ